MLFHFLVIYHFLVIWDFSGYHSNALGFFIL